MKAVVTRSYGLPDNVVLEDVDPQALGDTDLLLRVRAASVNALDWRFAAGRPFIMRPFTGWTKPKRAIRGVDVAGVVESVGAKVTRFRPADEVFGLASGSFAERAPADETELLIKPEEMSFEVAASLPVAGCTALHALRKPGPFEPGTRVLVNGAAGGVGSFTVQIAKAWGAAHVTGVCSTGKVELVRSLGADEVVDYRKDDFASQSDRYDLVVDAVGNRSLRDLRRVMTPKGSLVLVGGGGGSILGPMAQMGRAAVMKRFVGQKVVTVMSKVDRDSLQELCDLYGAGMLTPAIERTCTLPEAPAAIYHLANGKAAGKTVILLES